MYVYEPGEDSYLLAEVLKGIKCRRFLDMGCGTGLQAISIGNAKEIVCADINKDAVDYAKECVKRGDVQRIEFVVSDLFRNIGGKFDVIAFNTPYLDEGEPRDLAWTYLQDGQDIIERFIRESKKHLEEGGQVIMLISDRGYEHYKKVAEEIGYSWEVLREKALFFEKIFVVCLKNRL
ncbi:MAG: methyltransferase [Candidatus Micrarchaeota archaeon]|nr:methyltransferase [Candidatus Micrarchaeota archaeon]